MSDVRVVISDFGGVLTNPLHEAFLEWEEHSRIPLTELGKAMMVVGEDLGENPLHLLERGQMTMADFEQAIETELRRQINDYAEFVGFSDFYFTQLFPNMPFIDFLRGYKGEGGRLALLTNNVREWEPLWRAMLPVDELFETVVDSGFEGTRKPERRIYELTYERIAALPGLADVKPHECVLVDDIDVNCDAAEEFGFRSVRYHGEVEDVIRAVSELIP
jgi:putative hydrolase of the HAD superfamily